jgi:predicted DsbA family dithiol-disulfide isomerase
MGADVSAPPRVTAFFDFACPLCYVDRPRFLRLRAEHGVVLDFIPFELRPGILARTSPETMGATHSPRVEEYLDRVAAEEGTPLAHPDFVPNSHDALALAELARDAGPAYYESMQGAIFAAYLGAGRDISDRSVLTQIAAKEGFDSAQIARVWEERVYDERLAALRAYAIQIGVAATPSAIVCDRLLIGSRPYGVLEQALAACTGSGVALAEEGEALASVGETPVDNENEGDVATSAEG